jgi:diguanylate cyclase (GGDEF)-like protein/putative nucleotidyltransferase with HDIG domain
MESYATGSMSEPESVQPETVAGHEVDAIPVLEARETSGMTSKLVLAYAEREGGRQAVEEILRRCGLEDRERDLRDEGSWFSYATKLRLFETVASVLDDPHALRKLGENVLDLSVGEGLKATLRALGTPGLVYRNVVRANARFSAVQGMELIEIGRDHARVRFVDLAGVGYHRLDCDYTAGLLSCVPALFGQPLARVSHPACGVDGADACIYDLYWSEHVSPQRTVIGSALAAALAVGGSALLAPALLPAGVAVAGVAGGAAAWKVHRVNRRRWDQLEREAREHAELGQRLAASLQDLTGELRLDELLDKITRNAQSAVGGKEYALIVEEEGLHRCLGSSGLPGGTVDSLERWLANLQTRLVEPLLVDDVTVVSELADIALQETMPLRSVCAVPLTYGGRSRGALVALANQPRTFLPRDVDLLSSYAVQAAIALFNARLFEMQERLAAHDSLTGLLNRRQLHEHLAREIERCRRDGGSFGVVLLDLDGFKLVNDTSGHSEGDEVLRRVAEAMSRSSRRSDVVFRAGGDEFAVLLTGAPERDEAVASAERVCAAIRSADVRVNASYGLASWPADGADQDALLAAADSRLYAMKGVRSRRLLAARDGGDAGASAGRRRRLAVVSRLSATLAPLRDPAQIADAAVAELTRSFDRLNAMVTRVEPDGSLRPLAGELSAKANGDRPVPAAKASLPIRVGGRTWGMLELESGDADLDDDLLLLDTVAAQLGAALERAELLFRLERTFADTVAVLSDALEAKDVYTATHTREVAALAERVGARLGVEGDELRALRHAALLHDIGKIAVRGDVLNKPGPLSEDEFAEIKQHTLIGVRMLERVEELSSVLPLIRSAHERWDGRGYPDGIAGDSIPLGARVICACDAFHAMVSDRPYRAALSYEDAVAELAACAGSQFDPAVVDALLAELDRA